MPRPTVPLVAFTPSPSHGVRLALGLALLAALACASDRTASAPPETYSGFLPDYTRLEPVGDGDAALVWVREDEPLGGFTAIRLDPVEVRHGVGSPIHDLPPEDVQTLADHLFAAMYRALERDYPLVKRMGPGVLRVQVALTDVRGSDVAMDTLSTVMPIRPISRLEQLATGTQAFVGSAGIEAKLSDGESGQMVAAVVDRRAGTKHLDGVDDAWTDVLAAFDFWAEALAQTLADARAETARR